MRVSQEAKIIPLTKVLLSEKNKNTILIKTRKTQNCRKLRTRSQIPF
jgi:hypothetical protein